MQDLGDSKPHISLLICNLLHIFLRVFSPDLMCKTLCLGLNSALLYVWANILFYPGRILYKRLAGTGTY